MINNSTLFFRIVVPMETAETSEPFPPLLKKTGGLRPPQPPQRPLRGPFGSAQRSQRPPSASVPRWGDAPPGPPQRPLRGPFGSAQRSQRPPSASVPRGCQAPPANPPHADAVTRRNSMSGHAKIMPSGTGRGPPPPLRSLDPFAATLRFAPFTPFGVTPLRGDGGRRRSCRQSLAVRSGSSFRPFRHSFAGPVGRHPAGPPYVRPSRGVRCGALSRRLLASLLGGFGRATLPSPSPPHRARLPSPLALPGSASLVASLLGRPAGFWARGAIGVPFAFAHGTTFFFCGASPRSVPPNGRLSAGRVLAASPPVWLFGGGPSVPRTSPISAIFVCSRHYIWYYL